MGVFVPEVDYVAATTLDEALAALSDHPGGRLLAGGHDLVPDLKAGRTAASLLVDLRKVPGLREVTHDHSSGRVRIGAMATLNELAGNVELTGHLQALGEAVRSIGDAQVRNWTTVGGSLASRHTAADLAAVALALGAEVHTVKPGGAGVHTAEELLSAPTSPLAEVEIITAVDIVIPTMSGSAYERQRNPATLYPIAAIAAQVVRTSDNIVGQCRVAATGVFDRPVRLNAVESSVAGTRPSHDTLAMASLKAREAEGAVSDLFASGEYRLHLATVLAERALVRAAQDAGFRFE